MAFRIILSLMIAFSYSVNCSAQSILFSVTNPDTDLLTMDIASASDGYFLAGYMNQSNPNETLCWIAKLDANYAIEWSKTVQLTGTTFANRLELLTKANDTVYLVSASSSNDSLFTDVFKMTATGNITWNKSICFPQSQILTPNYLSPVLQNGQLILHCFDQTGTIRTTLSENGDLLDSKHFHLTENGGNLSLYDVGNYPIPCSDGGTLLVQQLTGNQPVVTRLANDGSIVWSTKIAHPTRVVRLSCGVEKDGGFYLVGVTTDPNDLSNNSPSINCSVQLSSSGTVLSFHQNDIGYTRGITQLFPLQGSEYFFSDSEGLIGKIDFGNQTIVANNLSMAYHDFVYLHELNGQFGITGLANNWQETKFTVFSGNDWSSCIPSTQTNGTFIEIPVEEFTFTNNPPITVSPYGNLANSTLSEQTVLLDLVNECTLGIKEPENADNFVIYPNPNHTGSELTIRLDHTPTNQAKVILTDLSGIEIESFPVSERTVTITLPELTTGLYFIHYTNYITGFSQLTKLVVQ